MTEAMEKYKLTKLDLFAPNPLLDNLPELQPPTLQMRTYDCYGVRTTLFLRHELEKRAQYLLGTLHQRERSRRKTSIDRALLKTGTSWDPNTFTWRSVIPKDAATGHSPTELQDLITKDVYRFHEGKALSWHWGRR
jgi:hypothetical protein